MYFSPVKRGPQIIDMRALGFDDSLFITWEAIRASMGMVEGIPVLRHPVWIKEGGTKANKRKEEESLAKY